MPPHQIAKMEQNSKTTKRYAPYRTFFSILEKVCFTMLAITTSLMVYKAFGENIKSITGDAYYTLSIALIIGSIYFIVDHGLSSNIKKYLRDKWEIKSQKAAPEYRAQRALLNTIFVVIAARLLLTGFSSIWAGDEIGAALHQGDPTATYRNQAAANDSLATAKTTLAESEYRKAESSEAQRVANAAAQGDRLIASAIASGNIHQREMYKTAPGFFNKPPRGQYYADNKAYGQRISEAKAKKAQLIAAEQAVTQQAKNLFYGVSKDTTLAANNTVLYSLAAEAAQREAAAQRRHTTMIKLVDWLFLIFGLISCIVLVRIERVTGYIPDDRSLGYILSALLEKWQKTAWDWIEEFTGLDLDGNGQIGSTVPPSAPTLPGGAYIKNLTSSPPPVIAGDNNGRIVVEGFRRSGAAAPPPPPTLPNTAPAAPPPPPPEKDELIISKSLAKEITEEEELALHIQALIGDFKHCRKQYFAWKNHREQSQKQTAIDNAQSKMDGLLKQMRYNLQCLQVAGADTRDLELPE